MHVADDIAKPNTRPAAKPTTPLNTHHKNEQPTAASIMHCSWDRPTKQSNNKQSLLLYDYFVLNING